MNPKSVIQITMILFLVLILYFLGTRIHINVEKVKEIQDISVPPSIPPVESLELTPAPTITLEKNKGVLGPHGYVTDEMVDQMNTYPNKNPMMYKKTERVLLNNLVE